MNVLIIGGTGVIGEAVLWVMSEYDVTFTYNNNQKKAKTLAFETGAGFFQYSSLGDDLGAKINKNYDVFIDCSGVNYPNDFDKTTLDDLTNVFASNAIGPFKMAQQILPFITNEGSMIFLSSSSAWTGGPRSVHYAMSKAGIDSMVKGLARFVADRQIRVNAVCPGYIESPMANKAQSPDVQKVIDNILLGRMGTPWEVAKVILFLVKTTYINGQVIRVDGGMI